MRKEYEDIKQKMTPYVRKEANRACDMIERCRLLKIDITDKKNLYFIAKWVIKYNNLNVADQIEDAHDWLLKNIAKKTSRKSETVRRLLHQYSKDN